MELGGGGPRPAGHVDPGHLAREAGGLDGGVRQVAGEGMLAQDLRDLPPEAGRDPEASHVAKPLEERGGQRPCGLGPGGGGRLAELIARRGLCHEAHLEIGAGVGQPGAQPEARRRVDGVDPAGDGPLVRAGPVEEPALDRHGITLSRPGSDPFRERGADPGLKVMAGRRGPCRRRAWRRGRGRTRGTSGAIPPPATRSRG